MATLYSSLPLRSFKPVFSKKSNECKVCSEILKAFQQPASEEYIAPLGSVSSILPLRSACSDHSALIGDALSKHDRRREPVGFRLQKTSTDLTSYDRQVEIIKSMSSKTIDFCLVFRDERTYLSIEKNLVFRSDVKSHYGNAVILDESYIDINRIKQWKTECENCHERCKTRHEVNQTPQIRPKLLIDTENRCIVSGDDMNEDFVALSYCWGVPEPGKPGWFRNEKSIFNELMRPNALSPTGEFGMKLPGTIKDTIELVQAIGERYLWIDSLCIVQDDADMKNSELPKMTEIYAFACLTVVAAEGSHADFGLAGFEFSKKRSIQQSVIKIGQERLVNPIQYVYEKNGVAYHTRGWTFQEYNFAKRRLIFEEQSVRWECREVGWCEDLVSNVDVGIEDSDTSWDLAGSKNPDVLELNDLINEYNSRDLGRKEDALPAFLGMQKVLSQYYPRGFLYGMPVHYFDIAMAWRPLSYSVNRRESSTPHLNPPTWSWLGWSGKVDFSYSGDQLLKDTTYKTLHVTKLVDWSAMIHPDSPKLPIESCSQSFEDNWSLNNEPKILFCQTFRVFLHFGEHLFKSEIDQICYGPWYSVRNNSGEWSGVLRLHSEEDTKQFDTSNKNESVVELVAISKGYGRDEMPRHGDHGLTEWYAKDRSRREGEDYHYYNVLCIGWENGVAFRKCSGRIAKEMWESSNPEQIDLILG
jgi:Heterokaryon incompatibility protein (HET)